MRTQIEKNAIRRGDLIRAENTADHDLAREFRARWDGDGGSWSIPSTFYLLSRPTPVVELPTEPTLGWVEQTVQAGERPILGVWDLRGRDGWLWSNGGLSCEPDSVTAFTPAVAVPLAALLHLRRQQGSDGQGATTSRAFSDFLAAVDAANGPSA